MNHFFERKFYECIDVNYVKYSCKRDKKQNTISQRDISFNRV